MPRPKATSSREFLPWAPTTTLAARHLTRSSALQALEETPLITQPSGARFGQVQRPADQRVPAAGGIGQGDRRLPQRDIADSAAVLAIAAAAPLRDRLSLKGPVSSRSRRAHPL